MTTRATKDRIRTAKGAERKAIVKLVNRLMVDFSACTTDRMRAHTAEAFLAAVAEIRALPADTVGISREGEVG